MVFLDIKFLVQNGMSLILFNTASQMWTLGQFLPLVIGDKVPPQNKYWINFINLLIIIDILFAPKVHSSECGYLESLISDHHMNFRQLYPDVRITPKLHYMVHMPRLILE